MFIIGKIIIVQEGVVIHEGESHEYLNEALQGSIIMNDVQVALPSVSAFIELLRLMETEVQLL